MATIAKLDPIKVGDTPTFEVDLEDLNGTGWTGVTYDMVLTANSAPVDNSDAIAVRIGQTLTINADATATAVMTLTTVEANKLTAQTNYFFEIQLKSGGLVSTVFTGQIQAVQDYIKG